MYQKTISTDQPGGYSALAFSDRFKQLGASVGKSNTVARTADRQEILAAAAHARLSIKGLASDAVVAKLHAHNAQIFQWIEKDGAPVSRPQFLALLPLNEQGVDALLSGQFSPAEPDVALVCREGEMPAGLYVWLMFVPSGFAAAIRALDPFLARVAPQGCPIFARAINEKAGRLFAKSGFMAATVHYPTAPAGLLVVPSLSRPSTAPNSEGPRHMDMRVRVARTLEDIMKGFSIRAATYMAEQQCPYEEEYDGNDFCATHLIGEIGGEPAGCIRVRFFSDFVKIERLAVRQEYRNSKLAFRLVREALGYAKKKGYRRAYGHSRTDLTRFWGLFGFRPIAERSPFIFSDVEYVELEADLGAAEDSIAIGADPYVLIRPEGEWDRPGPLDRSVDRYCRRPEA